MSSTSVDGPSSLPLQRVSSNDAQGELSQIPSNDVASFSRSDYGFLDGYDGESDGGMGQDSSMHLSHETFTYLHASDDQSGEDAVHENANGFASDIAMTDVNGGNDGDDNDGDDDGNPFASDAEEANNFQTDGEIEFQSSSDADFQLSATSKKPKNKKKKKKKFKPDWYNAKNVYSMSCLKSKILIPGMAAFLESEDVSVDVEFPVIGKRFFDGNGNPVTRAEAMAVRCQDLQRDIINNRDITRRITRSSTVNGRESSHSFIYDDEDEGEDEDEDEREDGREENATTSRLFPGYPNKLLPPALGVDSFATRKVRNILVELKRQIQDFFINVHNNGSQSNPARHPKYILADDGQPILSADTQQFIYWAVDCEARARRLMLEHIPENPGNLRFKLVEKYGEVRWKLMYELKRVMVLENGIDVEAVAQRLVVQEFRVDTFWPEKPKEDG